MARTALTVQTIVQAGITPSFVAANTDGHSFTNNGNTYLEIINNHTSATLALTVDYPTSIDGLTVSDLAISVAGSSTRMVGPFTARFNQPGTTDVYVNMATTASASIAAFRIG